MNCSRTMTVLLALIILVKSLNCVIGESVFLGGPEDISTTEAAGALELATPVAPLHPGPAEQGCTDSGCLCKGFVEAPEIVVPEPSESLDDWSQLARVFDQLAKANASVNNCPQRLRPGDPLFADTSPSGRGLRQQFASLTL